MKILVTGAAGFLGRRVVDLLQKRGHEVASSDKTGQCDYVGDLADAVFCSTLPSVDAIVHCAAVQYVTQKKPLFNWCRFFSRNNIEATKNLLSRYKESKAHFVHVGTSMQYHQNNSLKYTEESVMSSQGVYSWSKLEAQRLVDSSNLSSATVIPCIIGGPGREGLFRGFVRSIGQYSIAVIPGSGDHRISIVHVDDVASLLVELVDGKRVGYYNAAAPDALSIKDWAKLIQKELGKSGLRVLHIPLWPLKFVSKLLGYRLLASEQLVMLSMPHVLDASKARQIPGFDPQTSEKIIADIVRYLSNKS